MLLSMTGYGDSRRPIGEYDVLVEVRAVNNRYFKFTCRSPEGFAALESRIEKLVRSYISRGTVSVAYRLQRVSAEGLYRLDAEVLQAYWGQLHLLAEKLHAPPPSDLGALLPLPGALVEREFDSDPQQLWPVIAEVLREALERLQEFRAAEGQSMLEELTAQCRDLRAQLEQVAGLAPRVVEEYRDRLAQRLEELLAGQKVEPAGGDLLREVSLFADRCDITEEITRLRSHLDQFDAIAGQKDSQGRKLDFLSQELFREINTIGSKANHVDIAHAVVEMKSAVEKMREILQNVQ